MRPGRARPGAARLRTRTAASEFCGPRGLAFPSSHSVLRDVFAEMLPSICAVSTLSVSNSKLQAPNLCVFHVWEFTQLEEDVNADVSLWFMKVMFRDFFFSGKQTISEML